MDQNKFVQCYEQLKYKVYTYVFYKVRSTAIAEDITSEVFLRFYKEYQENKSVMDYAQAWIYRASYNLIIDHLRSAHYKKGKAISEMEAAKANKSEDDNGDFDLPDEELTDVLENEVKNEQIQAIHRSMQDLKQNEREIIELRIFQELPFSDISVIFDIAEGAAKMRFKRAMNKLKFIVDSNVVPKKKENN